MNKKGQALVMFVMLLPIILMLFAYVFDSSYIVLEENKLNEVATESLKYLEDKDIDKVKEFIYKNNENINIVDLDKNYIHIKYDLKPIFGRFVGYDSYHLESIYESEIIDGVLRINKKG